MYGVRSTQFPIWLHEYISGSESELYFFEVPEQLSGMAFCEVRGVGDRLGVFVGPLRLLFLLPVLCKDYFAKTLLWPAGLQSLCLSGLLLICFFGCF